MNTNASGDSFKCKVCVASGEKNFSWDGNCLVCEEEGERLLDDGWHHDSDMESR